MKKSFGYSSLGILIIFIGLWIWSFAVKGTYIMIGGSTSCNELMEALTSKYNGNEVIYSSFGSQAGINGYKNKSISAGFVSRDLSSDDFDGKSPTAINDHYDKEDWAGSLTKDHSNETISITFGTDALVIFYKPPGWWSDTLTNNLTFQTGGTDNWLAKIYNGEMTWEGLARAIIAYRATTYNLTIDVKIPKSSTPFISYSRESGSGTRDAFAKLTNTTDFKKANVVNSNNLMVSGVSANSGSIGYISYAFNDKITKSSGLYGAAINDTELGNDTLGDGSHIWNYNVNDKKFEVDENTSNEKAITNADYKLTRSFSLFFDSQSKSIRKLLDFIDWFVIYDRTLNDKAKEAYEETGIIPVSDIEIWK